MSLNSIFPLFSSITRRLNEKLTSNGSNESTIEHVEVIFAEKKVKRSYIDHYYCSIVYRPEDRPTKNTCHFKGEYESRRDLQETIDYFNDTFIIMFLRTGVVLL